MHIGYGELLCGHKCHWEKSYIDWYISCLLLLFYYILRLEKGEHAACPQCKASSGVRCKGNGCTVNLGHGDSETSCSCSLNIKPEKSKNKKRKPVIPKAFGDDLHADELEEILQDDNINGICQLCKDPHPGYCSICKQLMTLPPNGVQMPKVYARCCHSYYHFKCFRWKISYLIYYNIVLGKTEKKLIAHDVNQRILLILLL